jgi:hypothetical protein
MQIRVGKSYLSDYQIGNGAGPRVGVDWLPYTGVVFPIGSTV